MSELAVYDNDPTLYLFTSLTAGSSHIVTATSRIETILKANKIPFKGVDTATDDLARKLYGRRAGGRKLPLLVKEGYVIGDLEQIEEWNEYDELKDVLGGPSAPAPAVTNKPTPAIVAATAAAPAPNPVTAENTPSANAEQNLAIRQLGAEAAAKAASKKPTPTNISTTNPLLSEKVNSPAVASPSGILSPRSVPLPTTPNPATPTPKSPLAKDAPISEIPKLESKPVDAPPKMQVDVDDPAGATDPVASTTVKSPAAAKSPTVAPTSPSAPIENSSGEDAEAVAEVGSGEKNTEKEAAKTATATATKDDQVEAVEEKEKKEEDVKIQELEKEEIKKGEDKKEEVKDEATKEDKKEEQVMAQDQDPKDADKPGEIVKD